MSFLKKKYKDLTDEDLFVKMTKGEKRAFDELYERYSGRLYSFFLAKLWQNKEKAEDFVHDLFLKLIQKPEIFDVNRSFKTWVFTVAYNMCKNEYRRKEKKKEILEEHQKSNDYREDNVLDKVEGVFFKESLEKQLNKITKEHREVFVLKTIQGLKNREIAEILGISLGTVKSRAFYGLKQILEQMKEYNLNN